MACHVSMLPFEAHAFVPLELAAGSASPEPETLPFDSGLHYSRQGGDSKRPSGIPSARSAAFDHRAACEQLSCHNLYNSDLYLGTCQP